MTSIIAIDPGKSGGLAHLRGDGVTELHKMPETLGDVCDLLRGMIAYGPVEVYMEQVNGRGDGSGNAMFGFGEGYGFIQGVLMAWAVPMVKVTPQKWQKYFSFGARGDLSITDWKNKLKARAQELYPGQRVTHATQDALLILHYALNLK